MMTRFRAMAGAVAALAATLSPGLSAHAANYQSAATIMNYQSCPSVVANFAVPPAVPQYVTTLACPVVVTSNAISTSETVGLLRITLTSPVGQPECGPPPSLVATTISYTDPFGSWTAALNLSWILDPPLPPPSVGPPCDSYYFQQTTVRLSSSTGAYSGMDELCNILASKVPYTTGQAAAGPTGAQYPTSVAAFHIDNQAGISTCPSGS